MDLVNAVAVPVIIGLVEVVKKIGLPERFLPLAAIALGLASHFLVGGVSYLAGVVAGLTAVGLYSGVRATAGK